MFCTQVAPSQTSLSNVISLPTALAQSSCFCLPLLVLSTPLCLKIPQTIIRFDGPPDVAQIKLWRIFKQSQLDSVEEFCSKVCKRDWYWHIADTRQLRLASHPWLNSLAKRCHLFSIVTFEYCRKNSPLNHSENILIWYMCVKASSHYCICVWML